MSAVLSKQCNCDCGCKVRWRHNPVGPRKQLCNTCLEPTCRTGDEHKNIRCYGEVKRCGTLCTACQCEGDGVHECDKSIHECKGHSCGNGECQTVKPDSQPYCSNCGCADCHYRALKVYCCKRRCSNPRCSNTKPHDEKWCTMCKPQYQDCPRCKGRVWPIHPAVGCRVRCWYLGCEEKRSGYSNYCSRHKCVSCNEGVYGDGNYCFQHVCMNTRTSSPGHSSCLRKRDYGPGGFSRWCRQCVSTDVKNQCSKCGRDKAICPHSCMFTGCTEYKEDGKTHCQSHLCHLCKNPHVKNMMPLNTRGHYLKENDEMPYYSPMDEKDPGPQNRACLDCVVNDGACAICGHGHKSGHAESCLNKPEDDTDNEGLLGCIAMFF